jgi:hypothetical protein
VRVGSRKLLRWCRTALGLVLSVSAGAVVSIGVAASHAKASPSSAQYEYSTTITTTTTTTTSTSTTTTTTPTVTKPGKGCGDKNHLHERRFECKVVISDATIKEGKLGTTSSLVLTLELSGEPESVVTVDYATASGTATSGVDYIPISGTLNFPVGVSIQKLTVTVIGDKTRELNETFYVNLSNPSPNAYLGDSQGLGTIGNDD